MANEKHNIVKLSKQDIATALELLQEGVAQFNVAQRIGVSVSTLTESLRKAKRYGFKAWCRHD